MKKKFLIACLSAVVVCTAGLAACGGKNESTRDKAYDNAEFIGYRKKVVHVLKDAGFAIKDFDGADKPAAVSAAISADTRSELFSIAEKGTQPADGTEDVKALRYNTFGQTFYLSLMLGDGLSNYYGQTAFYRTSACFDLGEDGGKQYLQVENSGAVTTTYRYSPASEDGTQKETFTVMSLDYTSARRYSYTCLSFDGDYKDYFFAYGDANRFIAAGNGFVKTYINNSVEAAYETEDEAVAASIFELVGEEYRAQDIKKMRALTGAGYFFDGVQFEALTEKYSGTVTGPQITEGVEYSVVNGEKVALRCRVTDGSEEVALDSDTSYIATDFTIYDSRGTVKRLGIPDSVKGVKLREGENYSDVPVDMLNIRLNFVTQYRNEIRILESITVDNGSPIFLAGKGSLKASDGKLIYLADSPVSVLDKDTLFAAYENLDQYKNLFSELTSLELELNGESITQRILEKALNEAEISELTITSASSDGENYLSVILPLKNDLTVNVSLDNFCRLGLNVYDASGSPRTVTVNVDRLPENRANGALSVMPYEGNTENLSVVVNTEMPRDCYDILYADCIEYQGEVTELNFAAGSASGFDEMLILRSAYDNGAVAVRIDGVRDGAEINIPDKFYGVDITEVQLNADGLADKTAGIYLPENVQSIYFYSHVAGQEIFIGGEENLYFGTVDNRSLTLHFDGTYENFRSLDIRRDRSEGKVLQFEVVCPDNAYIYSSEVIWSPDNPDDPTYTLTLTVDVGVKDVAFKMPEGRERGINLSEYVTDSGYVYFLVDRHGMAVEVTDYYANLSINKNEKMTLCRISRRSDTYAVSGDGYSLNIRINYGEDGPHSTFGYEVVDGTLNGSPVTGSGRMFELGNMTCGGEPVSVRLTLGKRGLVLVHDAYESYVDITLKIGGEVKVLDVGKGSRIRSEDLLELREGYKYFLRDKDGYITGLSVEDGLVNGISTEADGEYALIRMSEGTESYSFSGENYDLTVNINCLVNDGNYSFNTRVSGTADGYAFTGETNSFNNMSRLNLITDGNVYFDVFVKFTWGESLDAVLTDVRCMLDKYETFEITIEVDGRTYTQAVPENGGFVLADAGIALEDNYQYYLFYSKNGEFKFTPVYKLYGMAYPERGINEYKLVRMGESTFEIKSDSVDVTVNLIGYELPYSPFGYAFEVGIKGSLGGEEVDYYGSPELFKPFAVSDTFSICFVWNTDFDLTLSGIQILRDHTD